MNAPDRPFSAPALLPDGEVDFHQTLAAYATGLKVDPRFLVSERIEEWDIVTVLVAVEVPCPRVEGASLEESLAYARECLEFQDLTVTLGGEELFHYSHAPLCVGEPDPS